MAVIAHLQDEAFQTLLIAGIETYPTGYLPAEPGKRKRRKPGKTQPNEGEAMGLLFGQRILKGDDFVFNISLAVPMQTAVRTKDMVIFSDRHFNRMRDVVEAFPALEFLGSFHSHPWKPPHYRTRKAAAPSGADAASALAIAESYGDEVLEVILGITTSERPRRDQGYAAGGFVESRCGRFRYGLAAYCTLRAKKGRKRPRAKQRAGGHLLPVDKFHCPLAVLGGRHRWSLHRPVTPSCSHEP